MLFFAASGQNNTLQLLSFSFYDAARKFMLNAGDAIFIDKDLKPVLGKKFKIPDKLQEIGYVKIVINSSANAD